METPTFEDAREMLVRVLADNPGDYVFIDQRTMWWAQRCAEIGVEQGWLEEGKLVEVDEQYSQLRWRITDAGRALAGRV
jgi:hypothetical protein